MQQASRDTTPVRTEHDTWPDAGPRQLGTLPQMVSEVMSRPVCVPSTASLTRRESARPWSCSCARRSGRIEAPVGSHHSGRAAGCGVATPTNEPRRHAGRGCSFAASGRAPRHDTRRHGSARSRKNTERFRARHLPHGRNRRTGLCWRRLARFGLVVSRPSCIRRSARPRPAAGWSCRGRDGRSRERWPTPARQRSLR